MRVCQFRHSRIGSVDGGGFEPPKLSRQIYSLIHLATLVPIHDGFLRLEEKSWRWDLNPQPIAYKAIALPIELHQQQLKVSACGAF